MADETQGDATASTTTPPAATTQPATSTGAEETQRVLAATDLLPDGETAPLPASGDKGFEAQAERFGSGVELDPDGAPTNHRLRAEWFADRGVETDPRKVVSDDLIADAKGRLAAYDKAFPPLTGTKDQLGKLAEAEGVTLPEGATKDEIVAAISAARPAR